MRASRFLGLALAVAVVSLLATTPGHANCLGGGSLFEQIFTTNTFAGCGDSINHTFAFGWQQGLAVQRLVSGVIPNGVAGADLGALATVADGVMTDQGLAPGAYSTTYDWSFPGTDGCITNVLDPDISCQTGINSLPVFNFTMGGWNNATPNQGVASVISLDGNEVAQAWLVENAGVPVCDASFSCDPAGDGCTNAAVFWGQDIVCGAIPIPIVTGSTCDAGGCTLTVQVGAHNVPFLDDCAMAASKAIDCPRNMYVGRAVMVKRAACPAPGNPPPVLDARTFIMSTATFPGTATPNFVPYSPQDTNLNGVIDGTEVGPAVPVVLSGNSTTSTPVRITKVPGATDCAYLGVALLMDSAPSSTGCAGPCASVYTTVVSYDPLPISLDNATPVADRVINLVASKSSGKASVSWETTAELETAGFNLIGSKKSGGTVQLNSSLIQAKQGTTGQSASYSVGLSGGDLKGSTAVYVEVVKTNGAKERYGPASF